MKPEKAFDAREHYQKLRDAQRALNALRKEDPGIPPGSENLPLVERYDLMAAYLRGIAREDSKIADPYGRLGHGTTPAVWVELPKAEDENPSRLLLMFHLKEKTEYTEASITAIWQDPGPQPMFSTEEWIDREDLVTAEDNHLFNLRLNELEWSFKTYQGIAAALPPDYAREIGFPAGFPGNDLSGSQSAA